jgi:hypothetical protein
MGGAVRTCLAAGTVIDTITVLSTASRQPAGSSSNSGATRYLGYEG